MTYISTHMKKELSIDSIITIHYFEYMKDFIFRGESHNLREMLYVDKGEVSVRGGDTWYTLNAGDILFHQPNEFHAFESIGRKAPNLVAISFHCFSPAISLFKKLFATLTIEERVLISQILAEARLAFANPLEDPRIEQVTLSDYAPFGSQQLITLYLEQFLIMVKRNHIDSAPADSASAQELPANISAKLYQFEKIVSYMREHICEHLTVTKICEEFSISRSALQSLFHKENGGGAIEYFNNMKIDYAKELIRIGTMNFTEIAHYLSYSSLQYFSKQFKKSTGMSPLEYFSSVKGISNSVSFQPKEKRASLKS